MKMIIERHTTYGELNSKPIWDKDFDFLLFRENANNSESIYFNKEEINNLRGKILVSTIVIDSKISILYARNDKLLNRVSDIGCYGVVWND